MMVYQQTMTAIARGDVRGVREEGMRLRAFANQHYWPAVATTLAPEWAGRSRGIVDRLIAVFGDHRLSAVRQEDIERWYAARRGEVKATTANKELTRLKHLLGRAVAWRYIKASPAAAVKKATEPAGRARYLTPDECRKLLNGTEITVKSTDGRAWTMHRGANPGLRLHIMARLQTGARRAELCRLRWADVDMKRREVTFRHTKNGRDRTVPMTETLWQELTALPRPIHPNAYVFPQYENPLHLTRAFTRLTRRLGIHGLTFHDLRHDVASTLAMAGVPQRAVMESSAIAIPGWLSGISTLRRVTCATRCGRSKRCRDSQSPCSAMRVPRSLAARLFGVDLHENRLSQLGQQGIAIIAKCAAIMDCGDPENRSPDNVGKRLPLGTDVDTRKRGWRNPAFLLVDDTGLEPVTSGM
jgi:integrase